MKNNYALMLMTSRLFMACRTKFDPVLTSDNGVRFKMMSVDEAKAIAKTAGKTLFVFAHASWRLTCKVTAYEVLVKKQAGKIYSNKLSSMDIGIISKESRKLNTIYSVWVILHLFYLRCKHCLAKKWEGFAAILRLLTLAYQ